MQDVLLDPSQLQNMLTGMLSNPVYQSQIDPNQLSALMDPSQLSGLTNLLSGLSSNALFGNNNTNIP